MAVKRDILNDLVEIREKVDALIETLEILSDEELVESIRRAEEDVREGRVRALEEFLKDL